MVDIGPPRNIDMGRYIKAAEKASRMPAFVLYFITTIYGEEITNLESSLQSDESRAYTPILKGFYTQALDSGLLRSTQYTNPRGETLIAEAVPMLRRSAFIDLVSQKLETSPQATFLMLDIANLRAADKACAADWMLNCIAGAIQNLSEEISQQFPGLKLFACRYGGDEFSIGVVGTVSPDQLEIIRNQLTNKITALKGYYKDEKTEQIKEGNVGLKDNQIDTIVIPSNDYEREVFIYFFKCGIILDAKEIAKITQRQSRKEFEKTHPINEPKKIYPPAGRAGPPGTESIEDKVKFMQQRHPELALSFDLAVVLDEKEDATKRQEALLRFVESVLYDPLLGENVYSMTDFQEHLADGEFSQLRAIEMKFLKEINDSCSYVDGDTAIKTLFDQIKGAIAEGDWSKVMIARRGSTFVIGVRKDQVLSPETNQKLAAISSVVLSAQEGRPTDVPVGNYSGSIQLGNVLTEAEKDWYKKIFAVLARPEIVDELVKSVEPKDTLSKFLKGYFLGKRKKEHMERALSILKELKDSMDKAKFYILDSFFRPLVIET